MDSYIRLVANGLAERGFEARQVEKKTRLFEKCRSALDRIKAGNDRRAFFVPGRVEVIGKHTDYCGGRSVVAAVDQGIAVLVAPRRDGEVRFVDAVFGEEASFTLSADLQPKIGHWSNYPMTTARRIARDFPGKPRGADVAIASDLVPAAGMSSSSALIIASFFGLAAADNLARTVEYISDLSTLPELACYLAAIEAGQGYKGFRPDHGVGTAGGSEDHTAILCSQAGCLGVYSYRPVRPEGTIEFPADRCIVVASSGVVAEKTGRAMALYNRASRLAVVACEVAAAALGVEAEDLASLLRLVGPERITRALAASKHPEFTADDLACRFEHFVTESEIIVPKAVEALRSSDIEEWGRQVDLSQIKGAELLRNQVPETVILAATAREHGADASSAFGAGFGGSVWAMTPTTDAPAFVERWRDAYLTAFPLNVSRADFFVTRPGPAAFELALS